MHALIDSPEILTSNQFVKKGMPFVKTQFDKYPVVGFEFDGKDWNNVDGFLTFKRLDIIFPNMTITGVYHQSMIFEILSFDELSSEDKLYISAWFVAVQLMTYELRALSSGNFENPTWEPGYYTMELDKC
jgi:hypothetical protein